MRRLLPVLAVLCAAPVDAAPAEEPVVERLKHCLAREVRQAGLRRLAPERFALRAQLACLPQKRDLARARAATLVAAGFREAPDLFGAVEGVLAEHEREAAATYARRFGRDRVAGAQMR
ncbi:hypothetical protein [uncultured Methylobacterium sp.]|jgi:hypothetical protein|uniref:hypothetical protein n=1 Tax=uncultured Methylobacterium sp. TaxID=157278 RepID=UPI002605C583|nr:hypothetical protein [uncultured Methylobacterium sp.]